MSFSELRCFDAVARSGSFSAAADLLLRSQPTVTIQIAQLEKRYGVELFHRRRGQKITITEFGQRLRLITQRLFALENDCEDLLLNEANLKTGSLRIGASAPNLATQFILAFKSLYPDIDVSLTLGNSEQVLSDVHACTVDIGFLGGHGTFSGCDVRLLAQPEIVLLANKSHPATASGEISLRDLADETILLREEGSQTRDLFLTQLQAAGVRPRKTIKIDSREGVCAAAEAGLGMAIIADNEIQLSSENMVIRIKECRISGKTHIITLSERSQTGIITSFLKIADGILT